MIILYIFAVGCVIGIIKYLLIPIMQAAKHGLIDGYNGSHNYSHLYYDDLETLETENDDIETEIAHLESMIDRYNEMASIVESQLQLCSDDKKRLTLLNRLNTIDSQTYRTKKKIDKLVEKLD
jgi:hypothetical protein